jgi:Lrp/AsnC family transcriptional regulator, leucine-responsive regulatory protein
VELYFTFLKQISVKLYFHHNGINGAVDYLYLFQLYFLPTAMKMTLDKYDYKILKLLSENSRLSYAELGRAISLSQSATKERVLNLIDNGVIKQFRMDVDFAKLGYAIKVIISLKCKSDELWRFIGDLPKFPEILSCKRITGEYCLIAQCVLRDSPHLENLIDRLMMYGVPTTSVELSEIKTGNFLMD